MQFGTLATYPKREIVNVPPPFPAGAANNGLSVDPVTGDIVLGNNFGDPLQQALLFSDREIPYAAGGFSLFFTQVSGGRSSITPTAFDTRIDDPGTVDSQLIPGKLTLTDVTGAGFPEIDLDTGSNDVLLQNMNGIVNLLCNSLGTGVVIDLINSRLRLFDPTIADNGQTVQINGNLSLLNDGTLAAVAFPLTPPFSSSDLDFGLFSCNPGDMVLIGVDPASVLPDSNFSAYVSSPGNVRLRFNNYSAGAQTPPVGNFTVSIIKIT